MVTRSVILLSLVTVCSGKFSFNNLDVVRNIAFDVSVAFHAGCVSILRPHESHPDEDIFLNKLTEWFARHDKVKFQVMSYRLTQYLGRFLDERSVAKGSCFKWTTIVMVTNTTKTFFQKLVDYNIFSKSIYLIFSNESTFNIFDGIHVRYDSRVWLIQPKTDKLFSISEIYQAKKGMRLVHMPLGEWSFENRLNGLVSKNRRDLDGAVFRAGAHENWPVTSFIYGRAGQEQEIDGYFPCIWFELGRMLNFSTTVVRSDMSGSEISEGQWSGQIGQAVRGEVDVLLSEMDFSANRIDAIKHLMPILNNNFQVFFAVDGYVLNLFTVFHPFHYSVWIVLLAWILLGAAVIFLTCKIANRGGLVDTCEVSPLGAIFFILQTLCLQGSSKVPKIWSQRVLFLSSYLLAAVILPSYSAALISSLTLKTPDRPFDTLFDILKTDYKLTFPGNSSYYDYFAKSSHPVIQEIFHTRALNETMAWSDLDKILSYVCENKKVAIFNHATLNDDLRVYGVYPQCEIQSFSRPVSRVFQSMAFPKDTPYQKTFNAIILRMMETGLLQRQKRRYMPKYETTVPRPDSYVKLIDVAAVFIFLIVALLVSILILSVELINCFSRVNRSKKVINVNAELK